MKKLLIVKKCKTLLSQYFNHSKWQKQMSASIRYKAI